MNLESLESADKAGTQPAAQSSQVSNLAGNTTNSLRRPTVAIAGASGFVGRSLATALQDQATVIGLSRKASSSADDIQWRQVDLFSLLQAEKALRGADIAVYLVHSMMPTSRLTQGNFADIDLILADNFARAAKRCQVKQIVYLGGLLPTEPDKQGELSPHLQSRWEVEHVLASYGTKVIAVRAGLVVGREGSSFQILEKLVRRLPLMICPRWTLHECQPIALGDVVQLLKHAALDPDLPGGAYDVGGPDTCTYVDMLRLTASTMHLKRYFWLTRFFSPGLSKLWVRLVTGTSKSLVYPLVESLKHSMTVHDKRLQERYGIFGESFRQALAKALSPLASFESPPDTSSAPVSLSTRSSSQVQNTACSIQRVKIPHGRSVAWTSMQYCRWLPQFLSPLIRVEVDQTGSLKFWLQPFGIRSVSILALNLTFSAERSDRTRSLFYVTSGMLSDNRKGQLPGRFEFRQVPGGDEVVVAVLNFRPRLPWMIYVLTQAQVHLFVMHRFGKYLSRLVKHPDLSGTTVETQVAP